MDPRTRGLRRKLRLWEKPGSFTVRLVVEDLYATEGDAASILNFRRGYVEVNSI
jgi:hypothetical protein